MKVQAADYRDIGLQTYGGRCEWDGCGWGDAPCDVHHINYKWQQAHEGKLRRLLAAGRAVDFLTLARQLQAQGYEWDKKARQLSKSVNPKDLCVLCPNHHRLTHHLDEGEEILKRLPPRKAA